CFDPDASFHERLVARENVATRLPPVVDRTSGSLPRFPINTTLFKLRLTTSSWRESWTRRSRYDPVRVDAQTICPASTPSIASPSTSHVRLQRAPQHDRVLHRSAIILPPPANFLESARAVQPARALVRVPHLQEHFL